jgi:hypothetical protein
MGISYSQVSKVFHVILNNGVRRPIDEGHYASRNWISLDSRMFDPSWPAKRYVAKLIAERRRLTGEDTMTAATRVSTVTGRFGTYEGLVPGLINTLKDAFVQRARVTLRRRDLMDQLRNKVVLVN